jgi:signal transduction histidine kinase
LHPPVVDIRGRLPGRDPEVARLVPCRELEVASKTVLDNWLARDDHGINESNLAAELAALSSAAHAALDEGKAGVGGLSGSALRQRLLDDLRGEVIREWADAGKELDQPSLRVLMALEDVRETMDVRSNADMIASTGGLDGLELISEVAHDLRSPLTSILTLAETLRRGQSGAVNETQHRQLGLIYSAALALSATASDVMELAHGGELLSEERAPLSVTDTLESVQNIVQPMAEEKGLEVQLQPPMDDQRLGHALALSRVLLNLTTNSLKFTSEGFVEISAESRGPLRLEFSVRDSGPGIPSDALLKLYQPFRREPGRPGYYFSGTGLGLVICRKLVAAMGSELRVETRPGWGTRFYFEVDMPPVSL